MPDPNQNHDISLNAAADLTRNFRTSRFFDGLNGGFFGKTAIEDILKQTNCVGLRYYYGVDAAGKQVLVLVGVDVNNKDLVNGKLAEISVPCPNLCDATSQLLTGN